MPSPSVTYTFSNTTTADATQVNQNFTDLINGMTDGTKDFSISALTVAGTFTANGNVILGNASGDDLTITASLASSITIKTTNTYDVGSSTVGLRSIYFGNSGAFTTRLMGAATASYTLTLPATVGTIGQALYSSDASGTLVFRHHHKFTSSKTSNYTATGDETIIPCDSSGGAFTVTLPAASGMTGKMLIIKKTSSDTNAVTIDGNSSETIDGATTTTVDTQYEAVHIACDGSNWHIVDRRIPMVRTSFTPTVIGATSNPSVGTATTTATWYRDGSNMVIDYTIVQTAAGSGGTGVYSWQIPSSYTIDNTKINVNTSGVQGQVVGPASAQVNASTSYGGWAYAYSTTAIGLVFFNDTAAPATPSSTFLSFGATNLNFSFRAVVPISGWKG